VLLLAGDEDVGDDDDEDEEREALGSGRFVVLGGARVAEDEDCLDCLLGGIVAGVFVDAFWFKGVRTDPTSTPPA
jgi:hypothetical protein